MLAAAAHALRRELQRLGCKKLARVQQTQQGHALKAAVTQPIRPCEEHTSGGTPAQSSGAHAAPHADPHSRGRRPQEHAILSVGLASFLQRHDLCPEGSQLSAFLGQAPPLQQQEWQQEFSSSFSPLAAKELLAPALAEYIAGEQHKRQLNLAANGFPWEEGSEQKSLGRLNEPAQPAESERSATSQTGAVQEEPTSPQGYQQEQGSQQMAPAPADGTAVQTQAACTAAQAQATGAEPLEQAEAEDMQAATKRTYQPSTLVRKRRHGFLSRVRTRGGRKVIKRRVLRGRNIITA